MLKKNNLLKFTQQQLHAIYLKTIKQLFFENEMKYNLSSK